AGAIHRFGPVESHGFDADTHFAGAGFADVDVLELEHIGSAERMHSDDPGHACSLVLRHEWGRAAALVQRYRCPADKEKGPPARGGPEVPAVADCLEAQVHTHREAAPQHVVEQAVAATSQGTRIGSAVTVVVEVGVEAGDR